MPPFRFKNKVFKNMARTYFVGGQMPIPFSDKLQVYLISDDDTRIVSMTEDQYNALPYYWFEMKEEAPKPAGVWNEDGRLMYGKKEDKHGKA
jgi:hypothetical protein